MRWYQTVLIGNGLGRALDNDFFQLSTGIKKVWATLDPQRQGDLLGLLRAAAPPEEEGQMQALHEILEPLQKLIKVAPPNWLSGPALTYPRFLNEFLTRVAIEFFDYNCAPNQRFQSWLEQFTSFVKANHVNVATLNYDTLLYKHFIAPTVGVLARYDGHLVDGIINAGFDPANLVRLQNQFGYYLHLHGSPLFYESVDKVIRKRTISDPGGSLELRRHLILAHPRLKYSLIADSVLLQSYFLLFREALQESKKLTIFGYGGLDPHVNEYIAMWIKSKNETLEGSKHIEVVEWQDPCITDPRRDFWMEQLKIPTDQMLTLVQLGSVLDYRFRA